MKLIYPEATYIEFQGPTGGNYVANAPFRGVLHTAESKSYTPSATSYFGHKNPPHFTVVRTTESVHVYQHYKLNVAARAMANLSKPVDDVQTNRQKAIQIEICWYASQIESLDREFKDTLRALMRWIEAETGTKRAAPTFHGNEAYGEHGIARMTPQQWRKFDGWCGHQHVPENKHWDPGKIDIDYLLS